MNDTLWPTVQPQINSSQVESISTIAQLLLKLGVLYWRRGDFDRSELLLTKAQEVSADTSNVRFLAQCFIGLALVKTSLEKIDEAIKAYKRAISLEPEKFHLWNNLGNLYLQCNQSDEALFAFKQSIDGNPNDAIAWNGLATAHDQNGNVDEAIHAYKRAIGLLRGTDLEKPDVLSPELKKHLTFQWLHLAMLYTKKSQYRKAIDAYQKALTFDTGNAEVWKELGALYIKLEVYDEAIAALSKVIELNSEYGEAYLNLAYVYTKLGKHHESLSFYLKSIEKLPSQQERELASRLMEESMRTIWKNNAINISRNGDKNRMRPYSNDEVTWFYYKYNEEITSINLSCSSYEPEHLAKITADKSAGKKYVNPMDTYNAQQIRRGERDMPCISQLPQVRNLNAKSEYVPEYPKVMKNEISDPYVWNEKGNIHFKCQNYNDAITSYNKAIEIDPTFGQPYHNLALIHFIRGNYNESVLLYQESIKLLTTDQEKAIAWNGLGHVYRCTKDYESARFSYQRASELDKKNGGVYDSTIIFEVSEKHKTADFWNDLGKLLFKTGAYDKAASAFRKVIKLEPSSGHAHSYLARALIAQGQYKEAVFLFRKSIDLIANNKDKANVWNRLGDVYRKLNDYDNALKAYQNATALTNDKFSLLSRTRFSLLSNCAAKKNSSIL